MFEGRDVSRPATGDGRPTRRHGTAVIAHGCIAVTGNTPALRPLPRRLSGFPAHQHLGTTRSVRASARPRSTSSRRTPKVIERCLLMTTDPGDLVLDPTCGSGTTAVRRRAVGPALDHDRHVSRVALALARTRLMAARFPYYLLADSPGRRREGGRAHRPASPPDCQPIGRRCPQRLRLQARAARHAEVDRPEPGHQRGHDARGRSTPRSPGTPSTEMLFDQPYEDPRRSASPARSRSRACRRTGCYHASDERPGCREACRSRDAGRSRTTILDNLARPASRTRKRGRAPGLRPPRAVRRRALAPGAGEYTRRRRAERRRIALIAIGPEHGTVGPSQVREAAKEAVKGIGFDLLVVCGFAFDPRTVRRRRSSSLTRRPEAGSHRAGAALGQLPVLLVQMNPDLAMGDELLKKTGAGNLFMVFGEPDIDIDRDGGRPASRSRSAASTSTTRRPARSARTPPTTSPAGSSTRTTTARASSSATPTSPAPTTRTRSSSARSAGRHRRGRLGDALPHALAARSRRPRPARSPSRSSTTTATRS